MTIFTVTNSSDSGFGSLRQAITDANITIGTDTINFADSLSGQTINLSTGQLTITDSLTINGLGATLLKIDGGNQGFRVFNVDDSTASRIDVSINKLTITGGNPSYDGGGIRSLENLTVTNSLISGNTVNGNSTDDFDGGGIYSQFGHLTIIDSTISGNTAKGNTPDGGGIYSIDGDLTVVNSTISGNTVNGLRLDSGGGIYSARGNVTVSDSTISNNSASADPRYDSADGGGIFTRDGNLTVTNSTISGNSASGAKTDGGGLYCKDGNLTVSDSTISGNSASIRGGGIFSTRGTLKVTNSTISGNGATRGGGIFNSATFNLTNTIIANSTSGGDCSNSGSVAINSNNLIEDGSCNPLLSGDPNLGPLQNNGGPTLTHALLPGSIAINAGSNTTTTLLYDQRGSGFHRIVDNLVDIGAYEVQELLNQNHSPTLDNAIANQNATEDSPFSFIVPANTFSDVDAGDTLTYSATLVNGNPLPSWLSFYPTTRTFSGTPTNNDVGNLSLKVTAIDIVGASVSSSFELAIANINDVPIVQNAIADQNAIEGIAFNFTVPANTFIDIDAGDSLSYSATLANSNPLPSWLSFNPTTRIFNGTPTNDAAGTYNITVKVSDTAGSQASDTFSLNIADTPSVTLAVNPTSTNENGTPNLIYTFTRTGNTTNSLTVNFNVSGTATFSNDYTQSGGNSFNTTQGSITFLAGSSTATLTLNPTADAIVEPQETIGITLRSGTGYAIGTATTILSTMTNDDGDDNNNELIGGSGNDSLSGLAGNDTIIGNAGNDTLNGGTGSDSLIGNTGNDTYIIDDLNDVIVENPNEGTDTVQTSINFNLTGTNLENITLLGTDNLNAMGNSLNNTLIGNSGNNLLQGLAGNDNLDGKAGNDTLEGGTGNDTYTINAGDTIAENANEGTDTVKASFSYILADTLENLTLLGTGNIDGAGNSSNNNLTGNNGNNRLEGLTGNDNLNGGLGNDTLVGGNGNDSYTIDVGDTLIEKINEGTDSVNAGFTYTLGDNLENLTLSGNLAINGTGNILNNTLNGNSGNNLLIGLEGNDSLDGKAGNDTLEGGVGDDTYTIDAGDTITENANAGTDTVKVGFASFTLTTNFENLTLTGTLAIDGTGNSSNNLLTGNNAANTLTGLDGNDTLLGSSGNDTLVGGNGNDVLTGGSGLDQFVLNSPGSGLDSITDFKVIDDTLVVSATQFGGGLTVGSAIDSNQFRIGAGATTATTADHRFIYNSTNGALFFDPDGTSAIAPTQIATLSTKLALTNLDIVAIA